MARYRRRYDDPRFGEYAATARPAPVVERGWGIGAMLASLVYAATALTELLLALRFFFRLFGANPANTFVNWVYSLSWHVMSPFAGIFNNTNPVSGFNYSGVFEWGTVIAFVVWGIVGMIIARALASTSR